MFSSEESVTRDEDFYAAQSKVEDTDEASDGYTAVGGGRPTLQANKLVLVEDMQGLHKNSSARGKRTISPLGSMIEIKHSHDSLSALIASRKGNSKSKLPSQTTTSHSVKLPQIHYISGGK